jgi:hypothetical protein
LTRNQLPPVAGSGVGPSATDPRPGCTRKDRQEVTRRQRFSSAQRQMTFSASRWTPESRRPGRVGVERGHQPEIRRASAIGRRLGPARRSLGAAEAEVRWTSLDASGRWRKWERLWRGVSVSAQRRASPPAGAPASRRADAHHPACAGRDAGRCPATIRRPCAPITHGERSRACMQLGGRAAARGARITPGWRRNWPATGRDEWTSNPGSRTKAIQWTPRPVARGGEQVGEAPCGGVAGWTA